MEKSRNFVITIGALVLLFMVWIAWITFKSPMTPEAPDVQLPQGEMSQLRDDLSVFIADRLKKERPNSTLIDISLDLPVEEKGGLKVPYLLSFSDGKAGVESSVRAVAYLEHEGSLWKVTKVLPQKETIVYDQNVLIKADSKPASGGAQSPPDN